MAVRVTARLAAAKPARWACIFTRRNEWYARSASGPPRRLGPPSTRAQADPGRPPPQLSRSGGRSKRSARTTPSTLWRPSRPTCSRAERHPYITGASRAGHDRVEEPHHPRNGGEHHAGTFEHPRWLRIHVPAQSESFPSGAGSSSSFGINDLSPTDAALPHLAGGGGWYASIAGWRPAAEVTACPPSDTITSPVPGRPRRPGGLCLAGRHADGPMVASGRAGRRRRGPAGRAADLGSFPGRHDRRGGSASATRPRRRSRCWRSPQPRHGRAWGFPRPLSGPLALLRPVY